MIVARGGKPLLFGALTTNTAPLSSVSSGFITGPALRGGDHPHKSGDLALMCEPLESPHRQRHRRPARHIVRERYALNPPLG